MCIWGIFGESMKTTITILSLLISACTAAGPVDETAQAQYVFADWSPVATTYSVSCEPRPLVLDPLWSADEQADIRAAARAWEKAVGVDLGELPVADEPCTQGGELVVSWCVTYSDAPLDDSPKAGIIVWGMSDSSESLLHVVAHEMGHWVGIPGHLESGTAGIMQRNGHLPDSIYDTDIALWEVSCSS